MHVYAILYRILSIVSLFFDRKILKYHTDNQRNFLGICKYKYKILIGHHFNNILSSLICTFNTLDIHRNSSTIENRGGVHALSFLIHFSIVRENFDKKKKEQDFKWEQKCNRCSTVLMGNQQCQAVP